MNENFDDDMIETALRRHSVQSAKGSEGEHFCFFPASIDAEPDLHVLFQVEGTLGTVLFMRAMLDRRYPVIQRPELLERCNEWNSEHRWPKARLLGLSDQELTIVADHCIDLAVPVPPALVDHLVGSAIVAAKAFRHWVDLHDFEQGPSELSPDDLILLLLNRPGPDADAGS